MDEICIRGEQYTVLERDFDGVPTVIALHRADSQRTLILQFAPKNECDPDTVNKLVRHLVSIAGSQRAKSPEV